MSILIAEPSTLAAVLSKAYPGDTVHLTAGNYPGSYALKTPGVTLEPAPGATPTFTGPAKFVANAKPAWLHIGVAAKGATVRNLSFVREGDIVAFWQKGWNDYGIIVEAPGALIENCTLAGMAKGIHVKGKQTTGVTIVHNTIGPTIDSCIAIATSYGVVRGMLIGWNILRDSLREDAVQFMPNFDLSVDNQTTDISNLGTILYENTVEGCNENAYDMKGAGLIVIHGGTIRHVAGYSNGYPFDPKLHYGPSIMHGARTLSGLVIVRNVRLEDCGGGIKVFPFWRIFHNTLVDNNYDPAGRPWDGTGISQPGATPTAAVVNNLSTGHKGPDYAIAQPWPDYRGNYMSEQEGLPVTTTKGAGSGRVLPVEDARYFTDWFGRRDLPPDVLYLGPDRYEVQAVDYVVHAVTLDREVSWHDGQPVYWRSPQPVAGIQAEYTPPIVVEPPPVEPPVTPTEPPVANETVTLTLSVDLAPALALALREAVAEGRVSVAVETVGVTVAGAVEED